MKPILSSAGASSHPTNRHALASPILLLVERVMKIYAFAHDFFDQ